MDRYAPYNFFIRPRRFGKSLFISMIENYYDINKKDKFEELFKALYIGKNPTEDRNSGYKFDENGKKEFNPGMVIYFLDNYSIYNEY